MFVWVAVSLPSVVLAGVSVTLAVDRTEATLGDTVRVTVTVAGAQRGDTSPVLHGVDDCVVNSGGTSSRMEIIHGKVNSSIEYVFHVQPSKPGTLTVGPAEVTVGGARYLSGVKPLKVVKASGAPGGGRGPLFLTAELSSKEAWVDEQVVYTLKLYQRVRVSDISLELPAADHLTFKQLGKPSEYRSSSGGTAYQVIQVRYAVVADAPGVFTLPPSTMSMAVYQPGQRPRMGFFDDPFMARGQPATRRSEPLGLKVKPLPVEGRPGDFSGLVGRFEMTSTLEPSEIRAGESATLTVTLRGTGNVNRIPDLAGPELPDTKVYADRPVLTSDTGPEGVVGEKVMKWALVPGREGDYTLPPLAVSFFDITQGTYRRLESRPHAMRVLPGAQHQAEPRVPAPVSPGGGARKEGSEGAGVRYPARAHLDQRCHRALPAAAGRNPALAHAPRSLLRLSGHARRRANEKENRRITTGRRREEGCPKFS